MVEVPSPVIFVADYVQLGFNGPRLSAPVWPLLIIGQDARVFGDPGYRDALCALIIHEVVATEESPDVGPVIRFKLGTIVINPNPADLSGPEIAILWGPPDDIQLNVWRPEEGTSGDRDWW